ncbi:MAG: cation transporter [Magnetococcales bacterium]|nr:cation transporter [Magnetococcales bacterium]
MSEPIYKSVACTIQSAPDDRYDHCSQCADKAARFDFLMTFLKTIFGTVMGTISGSVGLQAIALQGVSDIIAKGANWFSIRIARKPPSNKFPYGYGKVLFLSSFGIGTSLTIGALFFIYHNLMHINDGPQDAPGKASILAALILAMTGEWMYRKLECAGRENNNPTIMAAAMDNRMDGLSSLLVLVGAIIANLGWPAADYIAALVIGVMVVNVGVRIVWEAIQSLLDIGIPMPMLMQIQELCLLTPGVRGIKRLRGRRLGDTYELDLALYIFPHFTIEMAEEIRKGLRHNVIRQIEHVEVIFISFSPLERIQPHETGKAPNPLPDIIAHKTARTCASDDDPKACMNCQNIPAGEGCSFVVPDHKTPSSSQ